MRDRAGRVKGSGSELQQALGVTAENFRLVFIA
jgi:hypothetical protein